MADIRIATQDDLPGPDGDEPYVLFVNQTDYGNARFLRTNVLSARPDLKKYTALRFRQEVNLHADAIGLWEDVVVVIMEAMGLVAAADPGLQRLSSGRGGLPGGAGTKIRRSRLVHKAGWRLGV
jgi:hypothetical protein